MFETNISRSISPFPYKNVPSIKLVLICSEKMQKIMADIDFQLKKKIGCPSNIVVLILVVFWYCCGHYCGFDG